MFVAPSIRWQCQGDDFVDPQQESEATTNDEWDGPRAFGNWHDIASVPV